jgi:hypothetical protein
MTSFKQIEANQRNARKSTGPITQEGEQRSRQSCGSAIVAGRFNCLPEITLHHLDCC